MTYQTAPDCQIIGLANIYESIFSYKKDGFFVEVGAFDGYRFSNVWGLAQAGWRGICFEPIPEFYRKCRDTYEGISRDCTNAPEISDIQVINTAIGDYIGTLEIELGGAISSGSRKQIEILKTAGVGQEYQGRKITVPITTLDEVLFDLSIPPLDVLSIDVEGMEIEVLKGFTLDFWQPTMIIIEAHEWHEIPELRFQAEWINNYMAEAYTKIYSDNINNIYVEK